MKPIKVLTFALSLFLAPFVSSAQTFSVLHSFSRSEGYRPEQGLTLSEGFLYGTTAYGGPNGNGILFKVNTNGTAFAVVHSSATPDWIYPRKVTVDGDVIYGTTANGGTTGFGNGTMFKVNRDGTAYTVLKVFTDADGDSANGGLVLRSGILFGTTASGDSGAGCVFKINTNGGGFAVIHQFPPWTSTNAEGLEPFAGLVLSGDTLYGTAFDGGPNGKGTVFKLDTDGSNFAVLHAFSALTSYTNSDGANPRGVLALSGDTLYGTTSAGGASSLGTVFKLNTNGSGFSVLHQFPGTPSFISGYGPWAGLSIDGDNLYGVAENDGGQTLGDVFRIKTDGSGFVVLHAFSAPAWDPASGTDTNSDGGLPLGEVVVSGNVLYGTAAIRGPAGLGSLFSIQLPVPPEPPIISSVTHTNSVFLLTWNTTLGAQYQVQFKSDWTSAWSNLTEIITATNTTLAVSDPIASDLQRSYRVALLAP